MSCVFFATISAMKEEATIPVWENTKQGELEKCQILSMEKNTSIWT